MRGLFITLPLLAAVLAACGGGGGGGGTPPTPTRGDAPRASISVGDDGSVKASFALPAMAGVDKYAILFVDGGTTVTVEAAALVGQRVEHLIPAGSDYRYEIRALGENGALVGEYRTDVKVAGDGGLDCVISYGTYGACIGGRQTRPQSIAVGEACSPLGGLTPESRACGTACVGEWRVTGACDPTAGRQTETYTQTQAAAGGGAQCASPAIGETREENCAVDCVGAWSESGQCLPSGKRREVFAVSQPARNKGAACEAADGDTRETKDCDYDCVGEWGEYGQCVDGEQTRTYSITAEAQNSGAACEAADDKAESRVCGTACEGDFGEWDACQSDGMQTRTYAITTPAADGGAQCPHSEGHAEERSCAFDCVGDYGPFGECQPDGMQTAEYVVSTPAAGGGQCPLRGATERQACDFNCVGEWGDYGVCVNGMQTRTYSVSADKQNEGNICEADDGKMESQPCGTACVGEWRVTDACDSITGSITGKQTETYTEIQSAAGGGAQCVSPAIGETRDVNCPVACAGEWRDKPGAACKPGGVQPQIYAQTQAALHGGAACASPAIGDERDVAGGCVYTPPPPIDCVGEWGEYSLCANNGERFRSYSVTAPAQNGGAACPFAHAATQTQPCGTACIGEWGEWSECSGPYANESRRYTVITPATGDGRECPATHGQRQSRSCAIACVGEWGEYGQCVNGEQTRTYSITAPSPYGRGAACPHGDGETQTRSCDSVVVDCVGEWGEYSICGYGKQTRAYAVSVPAQNSGAACLHADGELQTQSCGRACVGEWGEYGQCFNGKQTRIYSIITLRRYGGEHCPRGHNERQTRDCDSGCVGEFGEWTQCVNGEQTRIYSIAPAQNGGACSHVGSETQTRSCGAACVGDWRDTGACNPTTGKKTQVYRITRAATDGGACKIAEGAPREVNCPVACAGEWRNNGACKPGDMQPQVFAQTRAARHGGAVCASPAIGDTRDRSELCTYTPPPPESDCAGTWTAVSGCSASCGRGTVTEVFSVTTPQSGGGAACSGGAMEGDTRLAYCNAAACPRAAKDPIIAVVDGGVQPELFAHRPAAGETGGYFVNKEVYDALRAADSDDADADTLESEFFGLTHGRIEGNNAWAAPILRTPSFGYQFRTLGNGYKCLSLDTGNDHIIDATHDCPLHHLRFAYTGRFYDPYHAAEVVASFYAFVTHGDLVSGTIFALRDDARLLSRRIRVSSLSGASSGADSATDALSAFGDYNDWAAETGAEKLRIFTNSYGVLDLRFSADGEDCSSSERTTDQGVLCLRGDRPADSDWDIGLMMQRENSRDVLMIHSAGNTPTPFPDKIVGLLPLFGSRGDQMVSRCAGPIQYIDECTVPEVPLNKIWNVASYRHDFQDLKGRFIIAAGAKLPDSHSLLDDNNYFLYNAELEKHAVFEDDFSKCGIAKEWCITALSRTVPTRSDNDVIYRIIRRGQSRPTTLTISYGSQTVTVVSDIYPSRKVTITAGMPNFGGTSAATPRVAAAAAGVMRESGMTDGDATQKVLFKTAFKCEKADAINKPSATAFAPDAILADILTPDCSGDGYDGYAPMNTDLTGQGMLNYVGALEEAESIRVGDANGQAAGRLRETAFSSPPIFGDGVAHQLAAIDLDLIAASGNHYRHRPLDNALRPTSFAFDNAERIFAFGKSRLASPTTTVTGAQMFAHSETPFLLDAEQGGTSGFSYQAPIASGVFNFSYDDEMLPSRFNAQTTLLPEANISPYLDFTRKGMELSFQSGGFFAAADGGGASHGVGFAADDGGAFSFTAAQGGREDEYGEEAEAIIGMASYRKRISDVQIDLSLGALQERDRLLGAKTGGAFATADALTRFAGIKAEWTPQSGEGFADDGNADLTFFASVWRGETSAQPGAGAIFKRRLDIGSESYALGMTKPRLFHRNDEMTFTVFHPLRAYRAKAHLALPLDRGGEVQRDNLDLAARAREFDFSIAYRRAFGEDGRFTIGALYRHNPAHRDDAKAERIAAFSLGLEW